MFIDPISVSAVVPLKVEPVINHFINASASAVASYVAISGQLGPMLFRNVQFVHENSPIATLSHCVSRL